MIPKILIQTARYPIEPYVIEKLKKCMSDEWSYLYFNDDDIRNFFRENPKLGFSKIEEVFDSFTVGPHKADLFRYYFLYINGGVFLDSDAILRSPLDEIVSGCDFFCVRSGHNCTFNGFIGCSPGNKIIYEALLNLYEQDPTELSFPDNYLSVCLNLSKIVEKHPKVRMFKEFVTAGETPSIVVDDRGIPVVLHYYADPKIIPK